MSLGQKLHPYSLPDAGGSGVITACRFVAPALLTSGLQTASYDILHCQENGVLAGSNIFADVKRERGVAALVAANLSAVDVKGWGEIADKMKITHQEAQNILNKPQPKKHNNNEQN